ncbi:MAG: GNAT family N-acetyltransferase, partial [Actinomycetota bacterium]|nr:GNAT family N-acetyltransferase [Actinomycetota bacterium]
MTGALDDPDVEHERWVADVVLTDGESVMIRAMVPGDVGDLRAFHRRQSPDSIYRRFFSPKPEMTPQMADYFTAVVPGRRTALAVWSGDELIGWASYERWAGRDDAEVAFMVDDDRHGKGIATLLLEHLAAIARAHDITRFTAETLADNRAMLAVFAKAGWPVQQRFNSGVIDVDFDLTDDAEFVGSVERREQRADSRAMARLLLPRTVAVVGASDTPGTVGDALWRHLRRSFSGPLYAVNPNHDTVSGVLAYDSVVDIPDDLSLAVIAVPVSDVAATVRQCITKHVRGAVVVTDLDESGVDVASLVADARHSGMRIIGPASMGIASPTLGFQAALVDVHLPPGNVAVSMQSGSLGGSLLRQADDLSLGLSWFVSLGDKCDVSGNDLLQFWADDDTTAVVALYTETFGNPRKFVRIARRVARSRPIVAVRTGAAAITDAAGAIYQQAGVIEVPTVTALLDTARVLASQPIPAGPRVAVLTNSRSPGTLAEAAIAAAGLVAVPRRHRVNRRAEPGDFAGAITAALADVEIDAVMVIYAPAVEAMVSDMAPEIDRAASGATKPVVAVMLGSRDGPVLDGSPVPSFSFPEQAAAVLGRMWAYSRWRALE